MQFLSNLSVAKKGLALILVPVAMELVCIGWLTAVLATTNSELSQLDAQHQLLLTIRQAGSLYAQLIVQIMGLQTAEGARAIEDRMRETEVMINLSFPSEDQSSVRAWADFREKAATLNSDLRGALGASMKFLESADRDQKMHFFNEFRNKAIGTGLEFDELLNTALVGENTQISEAQEVTRLRNYIYAGLALIVILSTIVTVLLVRYFTSNISSRLSRIASNAQRLAAGQDLLPALPGNDEVSQLDRELHEASAILAESRRRESAVLEHATDVICSLDKRFRFQNVNQASLTLWAYEPGDLLGKSILSLVPPDSVTSTRESFQRMAEIDEGQFENVVTCANGESRNFAWTVRWSPSQQIYFCVVHDVTERRRMTELKREFVAMVSHDLRTPLASVDISLTMVLLGKKGTVPEKVKQPLTNAQRSLEHLKELVAELLELEKLESGKMLMNFKPVRAFDVCIAAIEPLETMASLAGVMVLPPSTDAIALGEERRLVQAVTNLVSNAIKFSPRGGNVFVKVASVAGMVRISVSDQGPGIPPEDRALIFERFGQSRSVSNVQVKSIGIRLAVVKAIAEAHNGEAGVDSEVGAGATFWIHIPRCADDHLADEEEQS